MQAEAVFVVKTAGYATKILVRRASCRIVYTDIRHNFGLAQPNRALCRRLPAAGQAQRSKNDCREFAVTAFTNSMFDAENMARAVSPGTVSPHFRARPQYTKKYSNLTNKEPQDSPVEPEAGGFARTSGQVSELPWQENSCPHTSCRQAVTTLLQHRRVHAKGEASFEKGWPMVGKRQKKPTWVVEKERQSGGDPVNTWLFGIHAVRDALLNPGRRKLRLIATRNAADRLADAISSAGISPEIADARQFPAPLDPQSVHQGAAMEVEPLNWGSVSEVCAPQGQTPLVLLLDRVTDPHNVGAILRSAEVFGARAVIAPRRHAAPESGALAKSASGALERQPYLRVTNLAKAMSSLKQMGYCIVGLDGTATTRLEVALENYRNQPLALALGAEGPGLRDLTAKTCDTLARIPFASDFGSLNVSNAAAVSLYAARHLHPGPVK